MISDRASLLSLSRTFLKALFSALMEQSNAFRLSKKVHRGSEAAVLRGSRFWILAWQS
jgi:hypothetical protein